MFILAFMENDERLVASSPGTYDEFIFYWLEILGKSLSIIKFFSINWNIIPTVSNIQVYCENLVHIESFLCSKTTQKWN